MSSFQITITKADNGWIAKVDWPGAETGADGAPIPHYESTLANAAAWAVRQVGAIIQAGAAAPP